MKKAIEVKGQIKVDNSDMQEIRAGSCAQYGVVCETDLVKKEQMEMRSAVAVDRLFVV